MKNQMIPQPNKLPAPVRKQVALQRKQMQYIAQVAAQALDEESSIYSYSVYKTLTTLTSAMMWKKASAGSEMTPEMEAWFDQLTKDYMTEMARIPHDACSRILQVLQELSLEDLGDVGLLEELRIALVRRLEA